MKLFEPIMINGIEIKNRIIMAGMDTNFSSPGGYISENNLKYYEERAKGGVGIIIVEAAYFDKRGRGTEHMISVEKDDRIPGLKKLASVIKKHGAKAFIQIYHAGAQATAFLTGLDIVAPSAVATKTTGIVPKALTKKEIKEIINGYANACARVKKAGFDGAEIHAGHGYLIGQFFSPLFNKRTDEYGGNFDNRIRFALEVLRAIREKCGTEFIIDFRINCRDYIEGGLEVEEMAKIAKRLEEEGVDLLNITAGIFDSPYYPVVPYMNIPRGVYSDYSEIIKKVLTKTPVSVVGRINNHLIAEEILQMEKADMITMGRALIADPYLPKKVVEGKAEDIRPCIGCNACLNQIMIEEKVMCSVNTNLLSDNENLPAVKPKQRILIIGAGSAGIEAARVATLRGFDVLVIEKTDKIGGSLYPASAAKMKIEIKYLIDYLNYIVKKHNINVRLSTPYSKVILDEFKPDIAIIAIGATSVLPNIQGIEKSTFSFPEHFGNGIPPDNENIVIIGGGMTGIDMTNFLLDFGKKVTILEVSQSLGFDHYALVTNEIGRKTLDHPNVTAEFSVVIEAIENGKLIGRQNDQPFSFDFQELIIATPQKTIIPFETELIENVPKVFKIGSCKKPRKIFDAMNEAYNLLTSIEVSECLKLQDECSFDAADLRTKVIQKIKNGSFANEDIPNYLALMAEICNTDIKVQKKSKNVKLTFQFSVDDGLSCWMKINNGVFTVGSGPSEKPDVTIMMQKAAAAGIITGEVNAASAYMKGQVKFMGSMRHGIKFQQWVNITTEKLGLD